MPGQFKGDGGEALANASHWSRVSASVSASSRR